MNELSCVGNCEHCIQETKVCQVFNKSVADNSVHPWECPKFSPKTKFLRLSFQHPKSLQYCGASRQDDTLYFHFKKIAENGH